MFKTVLLIVLMVGLAIWFQRGSLNDWKSQLSGDLDEATSYAAGR